ncbi:glucan endo-13-beta-D-glucosidase-like [Trifolium medium]|uniref:Glucan endo-13-beta-D-glucosidase-like n=1 Tax=Trifolium medium TaxID=97028 RepID=A0A392NMP5_9FABA|nr:glucan endo-13-beta-D-glucosidase-like [Trifolium medium]
MNHASVVMSLYFAKNARSESSCYFGNTGLIAYDDPRNGNCTYA